MYQFNRLERHTGNLMNLDSIFQHTASMKNNVGVWRGWNPCVLIGRLWLSPPPAPPPSATAAPDRDQVRETVYLVVIVTATAPVTHLTIIKGKLASISAAMIMLIEWQNIIPRNCCGVLKGEKGCRLNGRTMVGVKAWQMLLCARDSIDISLACQGWGFGKGTESRWHSANKAVKHKPQW